jgi:pyruvate formate lyase activating enzyme
VDAIKVDLKGITETFYKDVVNGELKPVLNALVTMRKLGMWTEIVYLVIPTLNDGDSDFQQAARWVKAELGVDVPLHFSRFHPEYLLKNLPPTPVKTLERAVASANAEGLHYVYLGNVPGHPAESTYCPKCKRVVVERVGFVVKSMQLAKGRCRYCQQTIPGVWEV